VQIPTVGFLQKISELCKKNGIVLILDEIQSGYGRSGKFFAHQHSGIKADIISIAKGMGNGFPVAGVLISPEFKSRHGMLGTTFGGNYLACAAALSVLEVLEKEALTTNAQQIGDYLITALRQYPQLREVRGQGLMIGIELNYPADQLRKRLLFEHKIFTGSSSNKNVIRLLPALNLTQKEADIFLSAFAEVMQQEAINA